MSVAQKDILNGWKEIAGYVSRDIRTVERWEKQRGLPVRRVPGAGRATVYARISELEEWLASKPLEGEIAAVPALVEIAATAEPSETSRASELVEEPFTARTPVVTAQVVQEPTKRPALAFAGFAAALLLGAVFFGYIRHSRALSSTSSFREVSSSRPSLPHSAVPGVDESYLRGTYLYEQRTPESLSQALESFNSAIKSDPKFAPAYAGLANTYNLLREYSVVPDAAAYPKARDAAERAIALDPNLAEAHAALGFVTYYWYMDAAKAEQEFRAAVSLDPSSAQAHHWYGSMLTHEGRFQEALSELDLAQHLQPASSAILTSRAFALGLSGHAEQARAMLRDLLSHNGFSGDPNSITAHLVLGIVSVAEPRDWATQFAQWHQIAALRKSDTDLLSFVNTVEPAYNRGGEPAMWQAVLDYEKSHHPGEVSERLVQAEANLGHLDAAFSDLNRLADHRDTALTGVSLDPLLKPLHGDPRFAQLRERLGLPKLSA